MHRAIVGRSRSFQPPPQFSARPKLVLIEGGRSEEFPQLSQIVSCLLFLHEVNSLIERNHQRRHDALAKAASLARSEPTFVEPEDGPVTDVRRILAERALDRVIERADTAKKRERPFYFPRHVLRQFVRWALGYRGGLNKLLLKRATDALESFHSQGKDRPLDQLLDLEFEAMRIRAKRWICSAVDTGQKTRKGYSILEAKDNKKGRLLVTLHHDGRTVIGIYTETHFGRGKQFSRSRKLSNQKARTYRKNKRVSFYRS